MHRNTTAQLKSAWLLCVKRFNCTERCRLAVGTSHLTPVHCSQFISWVLPLSITACSSAELPSWMWLGAVRFHLDLICNADARVPATLRAAVWLLWLSVGGRSLKLGVCKCYCIRVQVQHGTSQTPALIRVYGGNYHLFQQRWALVLDQRLIMFSRTSSFFTLKDALMKMIELCSHFLNKCKTKQQYPVCF